MIYNEDCLQTMFTRLDMGSVDLTVTSPPYDGLRTYHGYSFDFPSVALGLLRVTKPGGVIVWIVGDATKRGSESGTSFRQALHFLELGFNLHDTMIYRKTSYVPLTHNRYEQAFEYMFVLSRGRPATFNPLREVCVDAGEIQNTRTFYQTAKCDKPSLLNSAKPVREEKIRANVWDIWPRGGVKGHPAQFPEPLARDHILSWSNPGDLVYDPFMGSGTTAIAARDTGRRWVGSEVSAEYCAIAKVRLS